MSNYKFADSQKSSVPPPHQRQVHPIMRGVGCILMIAIPILSYVASDLLIGAGFGRQIIPASWYGTISFPPLLMQLSGLAILLREISTIPHLAANLLLTVVMVIIVGGVISVFYGYMYTIFGPPKYGPMDAPPPRGVKVKRYKR